MTHKHLMRKKGYTFRDSTIDWEFTQEWKCKYCSYTEKRAVKR